MKVPGAETILLTPTKWLRYYDCMNNEQASGLLPCPFCASNDLRTKKTPIFNDDFSIYKMIDSRVQCLNCGADGPALAFVEDVKNAWNIRK